MVTSARRRQSCLHGEFASHHNTQSMSAWNSDRISSRINYLEKQRSSQMTFFKRLRLRWIIAARRRAKQISDLPIAQVRLNLTAYVPRRCCAFDAKSLSRPFWWKIWFAPGRHWWSIECYQHERNISIGQASLKFDAVAFSYQIWTRSETIAFRDILEKGIDHLSDEFIWKIVRSASIIVFDRVSRLPWSEKKRRNFIFGRKKNGKRLLT